LLQKQTRRLVLSIAAVAVFLSALVAILEGLQSGTWLAGLLAGIALAIALLPEEIPAVLTVYTALGARRLARQKALTRRFGAIPTLGAITVLCSDKTGTLTANRMALQCLAIEPGSELSATALRNPTVPRIEEALEAAVLASDIRPIDPMEIALHETWSREAPSRRDRPVAQLVRRYPFSQERLAVIQVWSDPASGAVSASAKGAPEAILALCGLEDSNASSGRGP